MRLLEAIAQEGSISAGARKVGITYRAAWDALEAMSNVFSAPLVTTRIGGAGKGGASLTPAGERVIAAFRRLEAGMGRLAQDVDAELAGAGVSARDLVSGFFFKSSAHNALRGVVAAIAPGPLSSRVEVALSETSALAATVTNRSVADLGLHVGREVMALIKAPFVAVRAGPPTEGGNTLPGLVRRIEVGGEEAEIVLDLGRDKTIAALIDAQAAREAGLREGGEAFAVFDPGHVILAID